MIKVFLYNYSLYAEELFGEEEAVWFMRKL
jgi:hypothetical protein